MLCHITEAITCCVIIDMKAYRMAFEETTCCLKWWYVVYNVLEFGLTTYWVKHKRIVGSTWCHMEPLVWNLTWCVRHGYENDVVQRMKQRQVKRIIMQGWTRHDVKWNMKNGLGSTWSQVEMRIVRGWWHLGVYRLGTLSLWHDLVLYKTWLNMMSSEVLQCLEERSFAQHSEITCIERIISLWKQTWVHFTRHCVEWCVASSAPMKIVMWRILSLARH